jgi:hypothetical protein
MNLTPEEKKKQREEWTARNIHVMEIQEQARDVITIRLKQGYPKSDIILLAELILDLAKRFD